MSKPPRLHVVPTAPKPDTAKARSRARMRAQAKPAEMIACPRCSGREFTTTVTGALMRNGKAVGGTKALICTACALNGERVAIL